MSSKISDDYAYMPVVGMNTPCTLPLVAGVKRQTLVLFVAVQLTFVLLQCFVFYPCYVHGPKWLNERAILDAVGNDRDIFDRAPFSDPPYKEEKQLKKAKYNARYQPNWDSLDQRELPTWYDDAKVGVFLHWGVYSVPSYIATDSKGLAEWFWFYWKSDTYVVPPDSEHRRRLSNMMKKTRPAAESVKDFMKKNYPPGWQYTDFAPKFTAELFDPDHWADIFEDSGAGYVVLTSKHHDGFTLWGSKHSWNWNAVDNGPHRDLVGELGEAVKKKNLHYGLYHSLYEWFNPLYIEDKKNNFKTQRFVKEKMMPELMELVTVYKPDLVWSDGHFEAPCSYWNCTEFLAWLYNDSPVKDTVVTNDRWGDDILCHHGGFLTCSDRYNPGEPQSRKWESCITIDSESWGYRRNADLRHYLDMDQLTELLAQTISNGGNLLINVGPSADGLIDPIFEERLRQLGSWLRVNREAIYGTESWHTTQDTLNKDVYYTTKKGSMGGVVYAIVLRWPHDDRLPLGSPRLDEKTEITWVGHKGEASFTWENSPAGIVLNLPQVSVAKIPCQWAWVLKFVGLTNGAHIL